ncbi:putative RNA-directed DNA polymerase (reverse transcriptase) protein [Rhizobium etli CIAT 652]|uniref:Putative RNA-directed DNA polymerase (Reverse transcriptase) protein n=1 Tax=Rhizobium etli (strain CIAT 652) TaxID=491916 RepID=B3PVM8_RHIE6|nr:putative RNA-directed DNA polymerase (reverse transcriptase) protein [Rhizobium etli CIAT 652]
MQAKEKFDKQFAIENLRSIFDERIAASGTVGKDGIDPGAFQKNIDTELALIRKRVYAQSYRFTHFKQRLISKGAGKPPREIAIAGVRDRVTLRAVTNVLMDVFHDAKLSPAHFIIKDLLDFVRPLGDEYVFLQLDVQDFYPSLDHQLLLKRIRTRTRYKYFTSLVDAAVKTPTGDGKTANDVGVPQGLSVSNILSSIYMMQIDETARARFHYYRYVDDILVICKASDATRHFRWLKGRLSKAHLTCHPLVEGSKSKIVPLSIGIDYLGYHITPKLVSVRKSSYRRMMTTIMSLITSAKYRANHKRLLAKINLKITGCVLNDKRYGWMFFFSMTQDVKQLKRLDRFVSRLWRKLGLTGQGKPKTFVKAYHEIRFNIAKSKYIPRFDDYSLEKKMQLISDLQGLDLESIRDWTEEKINKTFWRLVRREVSELEKDLTPVS